MENESEGARLIAVERQRQVETEGWTPEHDAIHTQGELAASAVAYVQLAAGMSPQTVMRHYWPWDAKWLKPSYDPIRNLVKAGALIAAEIDRLTALKGKST